MIVVPSCKPSLTMQLPAMHDEPCQSIHQHRVESSQVALHMFDICILVSYGAGTCNADVIHSATRGSERCCGPVDSLLPDQQPECGGWLSRES